MDGQAGRQSPTEIPLETFLHLVDLAALELTEDEAEYLRREMNAQLRAIGDLQAIQLSADTPITSHGIPYPRAVRPALRGDHAETFPHADEILAQAPESDGRYIVVPDQPGTDLE